MVCASAVCSGHCPLVTITVFGEGPQIDNLAEEVKSQKRPHLHQQLQIYLVLIVEP